MKCLLATACLAVIGIAAFDSAAAHQGCLAGSKWSSPCFDCSCDEGRPACLRKQCNDGAVNDTGAWDCAPDTSWKDDCNWCHCSDDGHALCTKRGCVSIETTLTSRTKVLAECLAGSSWESNCHSCECSADGQAQCTATPCADKKTMAEPIRCKPNTTFARDCNTCRCLDSGVVLCSLRGCLDAAVWEPLVAQPVPPAITPSPSPTAAEEERLPTGRSCAIGSAWKSRCNACTCSPAGVAVCTLAICDENTEKEFKCEPESAWRDECNTCFCTSHGEPICTRVGCDGAFKIPELHFENGDKDISESTETNTLVQSNGDRFKRAVCKQNEIFHIECNVCECTDDGSSYKCTQNECMDKPEGKSDGDVEVFMENEGTDHIERHSVCQPSSTFLINCHTCQCNDDGTDYRCTDEPCPLPDDVELFKELQDDTHIVPLKTCDPNGVFYEACNKCRCNKDGTDFECTKASCKGHPSKEFKLQEAKSARNKSVVCQANKAFQKDCNTCWCNDDGTGYFCTRKVCVPNQPDDAEGPEKPEELRIIKKDCRPHEVFEVECNMCRCNEDGKSFSCTRRACVTDAPTDAVDFEPESSGEEVIRSAVIGASTRIKRQDKPRVKKCEPGQHFRVDCNRCLCDPEGVTFSCTRTDCTQPQPATNGSRRRRREVRSTQTVCEPGSKFYRDCNSCTCSSDGQSASCTSLPCSVTSRPEEIRESKTESGFRCTPGEKFKRACNDCTCTADGKSVFCTINLCEPEMVSQL